MSAIRKRTTTFNILLQSNIYTISLRADGDPRSIRKKKPKRLPKTGKSYETCKDDFEIVKLSKKIYFAKKKIKPYSFYYCNVKKAHLMGIYLSQKCYNAKELFCKIYFVFIRFTPQMLT